MMTRRRSHCNVHNFYFCLVCLTILNKIMFVESESDILGWTPDICPIKCSCKDTKYESPTHGIPMRVINCSRSGLTTIPSNISEDAEVLTLRFNNIKSLKILDSLRPLRYLDASNNVITSIDNRLQILTRLKSLDLHNNTLTYLQNGQFSGLKYLTRLDLSDNDLHSIQKHTFGGLNHLQRLHLDGNKILYLEKQWFFSMPSLRALYLSRNKIKHVPGYIFETLSNMAIIKLDYNQIQSLDDGALSGLDQMSALDISFNKFTVVPSFIIKQLPRLQYLYLDGNRIYRIDSLAFYSSNITLISVSYMPRLTVVEKNSFVNLPGLITLQLHDNQNLRFIDPHAFSNVPSLQYLYLHNNALMTVSHTIQNNLPSMKSCHLYNNPIRCDCNAYWIKQMLTNEQRDKPVMFEYSRLRCGSPNNLVGRPLTELPSTFTNETCSPLTLPLFESSYNVCVGEELRLECHGLGVPEPEMEWQLPNGTIISGSIQDGRLQVVDNSTLIIRHIREADGGTYKCRAVNVQGDTDSKTDVKVSNNPIRIIPSGISNDYVTVTWNGTEYNSMISAYQIHYRSPLSTNDYTAIYLGPYSTRYTFKNLQSKTLYEFCIVYAYETEMYYVDCVNVTTSGSLELSIGITRIDKRIVLGICVSIILLVAVGCMVTAFKKFRRAKPYIEPTCDEKTDIMAQIPLDNFHNPPHSSYMCSSKTSLISAQD